MDQPATLTANASWRELLTPEQFPRLALVCTGVWLNAADTLVTATVMPSVARDIGGYTYFAWTVAAYLVGSILGGASAGRFSERVGLHVAMSASALLYALGCAVGALAPGMGTFLIGRILQGGGAGLMVGLCYVCANLLFPSEYLRRVLALLSGIWGIATVLGPTLGGLFAQAHAWRLLFWLFGAQAALFAVAARFLVPNPHLGGDKPRVAVGTLALLAFAILLCLLSGSLRALWLSLVPFVGGTILLAVALRRDVQRPHRLVPREVHDRLTVAGFGYAAMFALSAGTICFTVYGAAILQASFGLSPLTAGYVIGTEAVGWTIVALIVAELPHHADKWAIRVGASAVLVAFSSMTFTFQSGSLAAVLGSAFVMGSGFGTMWAFLTRRILESLPDNDREIGSSAIPTVQMVGSAVGSALSGMVANAMGAAEGIGRGNATTIAIWIFAAAIPVALMGWLYAWRAGGDETTATEP